MIKDLFVTRYRKLRKLILDHYYQVTSLVFLKYYENIFVIAQFQMIRLLFAVPRTTFHTVIIFPYSVEMFPLAGTVIYNIVTQSCPVVLKTVFIVA